MTQPSVLLEVCVASLRDAEEAVAGGADRLELNCALELGGLTPSAGLLREVKQAVAIPVIVMLRPRPAGFCYDEDELRTMLADAEVLLSHGADGIALGVLNAQRQVDLEACRHLVAVAGARETVFHRAIDMAADICRAADQLIECGVTRILTSGQAATAEAGCDTIARLQRAYGDRIEILPGAGIGPHNVRQLLERTGCRQVHGTFSRQQRDHAGLVADADYRATDRETVRAVRERLLQLGED